MDNTIIIILHVVVLTIHGSIYLQASQNLALHKPAYQSSNHQQQLIANNSVDGNYEQTYTSCAHGNDNPGGPNWLVVDLLDVYRVSHVVLTPRKEDSGYHGYDAANKETAPRMDYLYIGITNTFDLINNQPVRNAYPLCRQSPYKTNVSQNMTITCRPNTPPGRYVIFQQPITGPGLVTICEIQIFEEKTRTLKPENETCQVGYYGQYCDKLCNCYKGISCNGTDGTCISGCDDGWEGEHCNTRKANISNQLIGCFKNWTFSNDSVIVPFTGSCIDQCSGFGFEFAVKWNKTTCVCDSNSSKNSIDAGKNEQSHSLEQCGYNKGIPIFSICPNGTYGYNCTLKCNCFNNRRCSFMEGLCGDGCAPGWTGASCNIRDCNTNNGGCSSHENCVSNASNFYSCHCTEFSYKKFVWSSCTECPSGTFGKNCSFKCYCVNNIGCSYMKGHCEDGCASGWTGVSCNIKDSPSKGMIVGIGISAAVLMLWIIISIVIIALRKRNRNVLLKNQPEILDTEKAEMNGDKQNVATHISDEKGVQLKLEDFPDFISHNKDNIKKEFAALQLGDDGAATFARQKQFKKLNRFRNIVPYDKNRVVLPKIPGREESDYINASYIKQVLKTTLIATQGPNKESICDFWRMVWQEDVGIIVMLCNFKEMGKDKCERYWPLTGVLNYGDIKVANERNSIWPEYTLTDLCIEKNSADSRQIIHLQYTKWPDHEVPENVSYFLAFCNHFRKIYQSKNCGVVVHCSAGVGRTGTFIAINDLLMRSKKGEYIGVLECFKTLRRDRMQMVQKEDQYRFIYDCLAEEVKLGPTTFTSDEFVKLSLNLRNLETNCKISHQHSKFQQQLGSKKEKHRKSETHGRVEVVTSSFKFEVIEENDTKKLWKEMFENKRLVIIFDENETRDYLPAFEKPLHVDKNFITLVSEEKCEAGILLTLNVSDDISKEIYENINYEKQIYENVSILREAMPQNLKVFVVQSNKDTSGYLTYTAFMDLSKLINKHLPNILYINSSSSNVGGFFVAACNIVDQIIERDEVTIFQNVYELQDTILHYLPRLEVYERLYQLAKVFVTNQGDSIKKSD